MSETLSEKEQEEMSNWHPEEQGQDRLTKDKAFDEAYKMKGGLRSDKRELASDVILTTQDYQEAFAGIERLAEAAEHQRPSRSYYKFGTQGGGRGYLALYQNWPFRWL